MVLNSQKILLCKKNLRKLFHFTETPVQLKAIEDVKRDMESGKIIEGASLEAEVRRNTRLLHEPAHAAIQTYTGVLFEALGYGSFFSAER